MVGRIEHGNGEDWGVCVACSHDEGSRPRCAVGGWCSSEALVESVLRGSCEASLEYSAPRPRCIGAQASALAQVVVLAHSEWLCTPAHRQSAQTPDAAGHCRYKQRCHGKESPPSTVQRPFCLLIRQHELSPDASFTLHPRGTYSPGPIWPSSAA